MRWPGHIPAGTVCREPAMTIDILPTVAKLAGAELPKHPIDGLDIWPLISGKPGAKSPHEAYYFYWNEQLQAVRSGRWKLHFPHSYGTLAGKPAGKDGKPAKVAQAETPLALYDLDNDIGENKNVADKHPDVVRRLETLAVKARAEAVFAARERGEPTVPTTIGLEKATNPFLRAPQLAGRVGAAGQPAYQAFAAVRAAKDVFRG